MKAVAVACAITIAATGIPTVAAAAPGDGTTSRSTVSGTVGDRVALRPGLSASGPSSALRDVRWRIVRSPRNASPRLVGRHRERAQLVTSTPGRYLVSMTATTPSGDPVRRDVRVAVAPDVDPLGLTLDTVSDNGQVRIGDRRYGSGSLRLVLVDRQTLKVQPLDYSGSREDFLAIKQQLKDAGSMKLAIVVVTRGVPRYDQAAVDQFNQDVAGQIGAAPVTQNQLLAASDGRPLSIVGVPGWSAGNAAVNSAMVWEHPTSTPSAPGSVSGLLQEDPASRGVFGPVYPDFFDFESRSSGSEGNQNVIRVGRSTRSASLPEGQSGFHVVRVDQGGSLQSSVMATNTGDRTRDDASVRLLANQIDGWSGGVIIVQSIGNPHPTTGGWNQFSQAMQRAGAVGTILNGLTSTAGDYAFVGHSGNHETAIESVPHAASNQGGTLTGSLSRGPDGDLQVSAYDTLGMGFTTELVDLAYAPPGAWPFRDTPGYKAALANIANRLGLNTSDPRTRYTDQNLDFGGAALLGKLRTLTYPGSTSFTADEFAAVRDVLEDEFRRVGLVTHYFQQLRTVLTESTVLQRGELETIVNEIQPHLPAPADEVPVNAFDVWAQLLSMGEDRVEVLGPISKVFSVAAMVTREPEGSYSIDRFRASAAQLAARLTAEYETGLKTVGLLRSMVVTDSAKLAKAGEFIQRGAPGWEWTDKAIAQTEAALSTSARRLFYSSLLRTSYRTYVLPSEFPVVGGCRVLRGEPEEAAATVAESVNGDGSPANRVRAIGRIQEDDRAGRMRVDADLVATLFKPQPADGGRTGLGFYRPAFLGRNLDVAGLDRHYCNSL